MGFKNRDSHMIIINIYWILLCLRSCIKYFTVVFSLVSPLPYEGSANILFVDEKIVPKEGGRARD